MNFLVGRAVEEAWAKILIAAGAEVMREERVSIPAGDTVVTGRKDFSEITGIRLKWLDAVVELKSINSRAMGWMLKNGERGKQDHRRQLNLYLYAEGIEVGYLVYLVKDATKGEPILHAWAVVRDDEQACDDLHSLAMAHEIAKRGMLAPIPEANLPAKERKDKKDGANVWQCRYCQYSLRCKLDASIERAAAGDDRWESALERA